MERKGTLCLIVGVWCTLCQVAMAAPTHVEVDLSGIGSPFEMEIQLYSVSAPYDSSWARLDNVVAGSETADFEDGTLGGFDDTWNPGSVQTISGNITGGAYLLEILEDTAYLSTIAYRPFSDPSAVVLSFDLLAGLSGNDELVISLLDPDTGEPMLDGLNGYGDILRLTATGLQSSSEVTFPAVVPAPGALGLALLGLLGLGCRRRPMGQPPSSHRDHAESHLKKAVCVRAPLAKKHEVMKSAS